MVVCVVLVLVLQYMTVVFQWRVGLEGLMSLVLGRYGRFVFVDMAS